ncbi:hypothetical protein [Streptomyces atratus]|uniref:hypothetical protein n=1 Tax=Streptomyces atratus TaxID=1893 RepID=UPI0033C1D459
MSFGNFARKVRDTTLPHGHRVVSLRSCVQLYRPIGFEATVACLEAKAGPFRRDEAALLRALGVLEASRAVWQAELRAYAVERAAAKRRGERTVPAGQVDPNDCVHWYGAPREGALFAIGHWRGRLRKSGALSSEPSAREVDRCAAACLGVDGEWTEDMRVRLDACAAELERGMSAEAFQDDRMRYFGHRDLLRVVRHIETAVAPQRQVAGSILSLPMR